MMVQFRQRQQHASQQMYRLAERKDSMLQPPPERSAVGVFHYGVRHPRGNFSVFEHMDQKRRFPSLQKSRDVVEPVPSRVILP